MMAARRWGSPVAGQGIRRRSSPHADFFGKRFGNALMVLATLLLSACGAGVLDPRGPTARAEWLILLDATSIMLAVIVPVIGLTLGIAWWFRAGNPRARYLPDWAYSGKLEFIVWSIPALVVLFLGGIAWVSSHDLDPRKPLDSKAPPLTIQVISLDWKWLFIYPKQDVASVNELVVPAGTPLEFQLTSGTVMNSFFVPQLGSQIYTMAGMVTHLNLEADAPGVFAGISAQFSGNGFSDMHFAVKAIAKDAFGDWVTQVRSRGSELTGATYAELLDHSATMAPQTFRSVDADLFQKIVSAAPTDGMAPAMAPASEGPTPAPPSTSEN